MEKGRVLIVDDDVEMCSLLHDHLGGEGHTVSMERDGPGALAALRQADYDVVIADLRMQGMDGLEVLRQARAIRPEARVIIMTAFGSIESAIAAMRAGAIHYVPKPFKLLEISQAVAKAVEDRRLREENRRLRDEVAGRYGIGNLLGASAGMQAVFAFIRQAAPGEGNVLIIGESGTGKELVARALHYNSHRADRPFVPVNCAAVPAGLLESELFGHVRGAFTGAVVARRGLIREAEGGTLFLDEIGDMAPELQAKLLRVLEDRTVRPVGGDEGISLDLRVVAATNKDLPARIKEGQFREDLYYRLAVIPIHLPSLRERPEDIPLLAEHFLRRAAAGAGKEVRGFTPEAMAALLHHPWPGNVRELENVVARAVMLATSEQLGIEVLLLGAAAPASGPTGAHRPTLKKLTADYVSLVLREVGGDKAKAAEVLGISKRTLYRWERQLGEAGDILSPEATH